ncbi:hypothetical protein [Neobacillus cucumis]|nr:hypothetical protein [Neobacillus cucumis]
MANIEFGRKKPGFVLVQTRDDIKSELEIEMFILREMVCFGS